MVNLLIYVILMGYGAVMYAGFFVLVPRWSCRHLLSWAGFFSFQPDPWWRPLDWDQQP